MHAPSEFFTLGVGGRDRRGRWDGRGDIAKAELHEEAITDGPLASAPSQQMGLSLILPSGHAVFYSPNKRVDPRVRERVSFPPSLPLCSIHPTNHPCMAWRMDCLKGGHSHKTMRRRRRRRRTPTQKEAEALFRSFARPEDRSLSPAHSARGRRHHLNQWCIWPSPRPSLVLFAAARLDRGKEGG